MIFLGIFYSATYLLILPCRSYISGEGRQELTPLHYACSVEDRGEIAVFLIEEEKRRNLAEQDEGIRGLTTPSYNMVDEDGLSPAFHTFSSRIIEMLLEFDDLEVVYDRNSYPFCDYNRN